ncbi:MAG TPA: hypothetical protein VFY69_02325 [Solirubrobacterales bacterium]|nr:hypothetical protein [Solirubrobacterales bacterium]
MRYGIGKFDRGDSRGRRGPQPSIDWRTAVDIVTILIIVILVLLAIYLFQRVF